MTSKISELSATLARDNFDAAKTAGILSASNIAIKQVTKIVKAKAPLMMRGYIDTPVGKLVIANLAAQGLKYMRPDDRRIEALAEGMMISSYQDLINSVDLDSIIDEFLDGPSMKKALSNIELDD